MINYQILKEFSNQIYQMITLNLQMNNHSQENNELIKFNIYNQKNIFLVQRNTIIKN